MKSTQMQGIPASAGVALGEARVVFTLDSMAPERPISTDEVNREHQRLDTAVEKAVAELKEIRERAGKHAGGPVAKIFDAQLMIASDAEFLKSVKEQITARLQCAEGVYSSLVSENTRSLRKSKDSYMRQMLTDIESVSKKVLSHLTGNGDTADHPFPPNTIIVAKRVTPAETLRFYERGAVGVVSAEGSAHAHMALIARALYLPAVVGADRVQNKIRNGDRLIVDGGLGKVFIKPDDALWESYQSKKGGDSLESIKRLSGLDKFPPVTTDGHTVELAANIELPGPRDAELSERNVGVGLYRTEFIYLQSNHFPAEDEQFEYYDNIAEQYAPQKVVLRTFDLGSDKYVEELQPLPESNPALGWRGIRTSLGSPPLFKTQLRAILRASTRKNVKLMLPFLSDVGELTRARRIIKRVMVELQREKVDFDTDIEIGAMIETPSAALTTDCFAQSAAFLSIGTNDLLQYTMAVDRDNNRVADLYRMFHPAQLRLIQMTIDSARKRDVPVTVCGEMAGDMRAVPLLIGMGANGLSMNPASLYEAASVISALSMAEAKAFAEETLRAATVKETEQLVDAFHDKLKSRLTGVFSEHT